MNLGAGPAVLAFDVGGTDVKAAAVAADGEVGTVLRAPAPARGERSGTAVVDAIAALADRLRADGAAPVAAGLVVPGHVDEASGVGVFAENLGWRGFPFRVRAEAALGLPVAFGHDVRAAGAAELRLGAAAPYRDVVVMVIGTGIAGAVFADGRELRGTGLAGEMGHSRVADGPDCACGGRGCLEAVASAGAIARRYTALTGMPVDGAKEVLRRADEGDSAARAVWESALDALALDLSHTVSLLAPEAVVIGGGLAQAGDRLFGPLRERLDAILTFHRRPELVPARIGEDAGVIGAALGARDLAAAGSRSGLPDAP
jgi:glucokinase